MKLPFFSRSFVKRLRESAAANVERYASGPGWLRGFAGQDAFIHESSVVVDPPPQLLFGERDNPRFDADNAIRIYGWLEGITPVLAAEERLWVCLAHLIFPEYMAARWPANGVSAIRRRYLYEGQSSAALARHGIARLWWGAFLTRDPSRADPFELTRILFHRQDIQVALLERSLGKSRLIRTATLDFLRTEQGWLSATRFSERIQGLVRELNALGGVTLLDSLRGEQITVLLAQTAERIAAQEG